MVGYRTISHRALFSDSSATEKIFLAASRAPLAKTGHVAAYAIATATTYKCRIPRIPFDFLAKPLVRMY